MHCHFPVFKRGECMVPYPAHSWEDPEWSCVISLAWGTRLAGSFRQLSGSAGAILGCATIRHGLSWGLWWHDSSLWEVGKGSSAWPVLPNLIFTVGKYNSTLNVLPQSAFLSCSLGILWVNPMPQQSLCFSIYFARAIALSWFYLFLSITTYFLLRRPCMYEVRIQFWLRQPEGKISCKNWLPNLCCLVMRDLERIQNWAKFAQLVYIYKKKKSQQKTLLLYLWSDLISSGNYQDAINMRTYSTNFSEPLFRGELLLRETWYYSSRNRFRFIFSDLHT